MNVKTSSFLLLFSVFYNFLFAQEQDPVRLFGQKHDYVRCSTSEVNHEHSGAYQDAFENWMYAQRAKRSSQRVSRDSTFYIPTVVHIVHLGEAVGEGFNIPEDQVKSQFQVLNEDYGFTDRNINSIPQEFEGVAGNPRIVFIMAREDEDGNELEEPGVNRIQGNATYSSADAQDLMESISWDTERYFNILVMPEIRGSTGTTLGFANFPQIDSDILEGVPNENVARDNVDGVYIATGFFGSNHTDFGSNFDLQLDAFDRGRTVTHEVGHWLGLRHVWGDSRNSCNIDDFCEDTPASIADFDAYGFSNDCAFPATFDPNTCTDESPDLPDMFQNYMYYTADKCMSLFTKCQIERMDIVMLNAPRRRSLHLNSSIVTGLEDEKLRRNLSVFPNPSNDSFTIRLNDYPNQVFTLSVYDVSGKQLLAEKLKASGNAFEFTFSLDRAEAGLYLLRVRTERAQATLKLLKE